MKIDTGVQGFASAILMVVMLVLLIEDIYEMHYFYGLRWNECNTKLHEDWFNH
jgi:hypothetical protein